MCAQGGGELGIRLKKRILNSVKTLSVAPLLRQGKIHVCPFIRSVLVS